MIISVFLCQKIHILRCSTRYMHTVKIYEGGLNFMVLFAANFDTIVHTEVVHVKNIT